MVHAGLPAVWARMKIADLADWATYDTLADLPGQIKQVALEYGLMSSYTAFVAVDATNAYRPAIYLELSVIDFDAPETDIVTVDGTGPIGFIR